MKLLAILLKVGRHNLDEAQLAQASKGRPEILDDVQRPVLIGFGTETAKEKPSWSQYVP
jgi:hypothetical protein